MTRLLRRNKTAIALLLILSPVLWEGIHGVGHRVFAGTDKSYEELKVFSDVLDIVERDFVDPVDPKTLIRGAIKGMISSLDPHSAFLLPESFDDLQMETEGEFSGIGIVVTMQDNVITVISPVEGSPAYKEGVKAGDKIIKVDGEETRAMMLWEAVNKMRGKKGTSVVITVVRKGVPDPIDFNIVRDVIPLESVRSFLLKPGYGYVRITNFRKSTADDMKDALKKLESSDTPLKGVIVDLRDNPGGLLDQAIDVADIFLDEGAIVSIKGRRAAHSKVYDATPGNEKHTQPMVLLINEGSASASEIVAGALQDHGRALVLGTTSFGKGSVQTVEQLRDGSGLKLTIARYYTPNGHAIQARGIIPDIVVTERYVPEVDEEKSLHMKEKDLKKHLSAEPEEELEEEGAMSEDMRKRILRIRGVKVPGEASSEVAKQMLEEDTQVRRAFDILVSWEIFSAMSQ